MFNTISSLHYNKNYCDRFGGVVLQINHISSFGKDKGQSMMVVKTEIFIVLCQCSKDLRCRVEDYVIFNGSDEDGQD